MRVLYFDCFAGAAGDMILGALVDAGLPVDALRSALGSLVMDAADVSVDRVTKAGLSATRVRVRAPGRAAGHPGARGHAPAHTSAPAQDHDHDHTHAPAPASVDDHTRDHTRDYDHAPANAHDHARDHTHAPAPAHDHNDDHDHAPARDQARRDAHDHARHHHYTLPEIRAAVARSALPADGQARAIALFERLAEVEAGIHAMPIEKVHLHEVGALDSIVDIVGAVFALDWFGADRIVVSPINVGGGMVHSAHGTFPVPAPATLALVGDAPIYSTGIQAELLTPTGALLLSAYADAFGPLPAMRVSRVGYGAGTRDFPDTPNVLRVVVGDAADAVAGATALSAASAIGAATDSAAAGAQAHAHEAPVVTVVSCEIDDMNPQLYGPLMDALQAAGALDVYYQALQMKKNRPGVLVTVVAPPDARDAVVALLFRETTTIGVRWQEAARECLARELVTVATPLGPVRFKVARRGGEVLNVQPEFEDLAALAGRHGRSLKDIQALAWGAWTSRS